MSIVLKPKGKDSAVDYVVNQIKDLLITGKVKPGDKLPSEFELAEGFGVSRGSVRSAMKVIEAYGIIDIQPGDGTYVCTDINEKSFNPLLFSLLILNPSIDSLIEFREKMEINIIDLIMQSDELTTKVLPMLDKNLGQFQHLREIQAPLSEFAKNDKEFHDILAQNCGNIIFESIYSFIFEYFYPQVVHSHIHQENGLAAERAHHEIYNAIKSGDKKLAETAVKDSMDLWYDLSKTNGNNSDSNEQEA